ncbi:armadillo-like helical domain containing protein 1 isoform X3 [Anneissia japonica]|uniref:armadillo-like helical domain containing protein 1 isoform X3 n=1 Tax=Anneissia japonica TaxID=1529436 RepID=UPI0014257AB7|nr:armadillo-like helical domain containing protein 1 isoform X3 [Anneissia japonica]
MAKQQSATSNIMSLLQEWDKGSKHKFLSEFMEVGGVLTSLEILGLREGKDEDKAQALQLLMSIASAGRNYKELICESYGIMAVAECLARSKSEETQDAARMLLQVLAEGNPKFQVQVYKGLIALLSSSSPKAQQMATQTLRIVQRIVGHANPSIVEPVVALLKSYHLEVQYEAIELIKDLMEYEVQESLLRSLVSSLVPTKDEIKKQPEILDDPSVPELKRPLPVFVQQAAAAKVIGILSHQSNHLCERLIQLRCVSNLMVAMGNEDHADSQRQASITLEYLVRTFPIVDENVNEAMGDNLYQLFLNNPDSLYMTMNAVQADVLRSNKVNIPGIVDALD